MVVGESTRMAAGRRPNVVNIPGSRAPGIIGVLKRSSRTLGASRRTAIITWGPSVIYYLCRRLDDRASLTSACLFDCAHVDGRGSRLEPFHPVAQQVRGRVFIGSIEAHPLWSAQRIVGSTTGANGELRAVERDNESAAPVGRCLERDARRREVLHERDCVEASTLVVALDQAPHRSNDCRPSLDARGALLLLDIDAHLRVDGNGSIAPAVLLAELSRPVRDGHGLNTFLFAVRVCSSA